MSDHSTHRTSTYPDGDRKMVVYCTRCSAEGEFLVEPCPGKFISRRERIVDKDKEQN